SHPLFEEAAGRLTWNGLRMWSSIRQRLCTAIGLRSARSPCSDSAKSSTLLERLFECIHDVKPECGFGPPGPSSPRRDRVCRAPHTTAESTSPSYRRSRRASGAGCDEEGETYETQSVGLAGGELLHHWSCEARS